MEKNFISNLCKQLKEIAVDMSTEEMFSWDSTDQSNMPQIESLDHADLRAKNAFSKYFKQLLCRVAYAKIWAKDHETPIVHAPIMHEQVKESKSTLIEDESLMDTTQNATNESEVVVAQELADSKTETESKGNSTEVKSSNEIEESKTAVQDSWSNEASQKDIEESKSPIEDINVATIEQREDLKPAELTKKSNSDELVVVKDMKNYSGVLSLLKEYNLKFVKEWSRTYNFHKWKHEHHESCAYLESGHISNKSVEFYKENVSSNFTFRM